MGNSQAALLDHTAATKGDDERTTTLEESREALDLQTDQTKSQAVLDSKAVMDVHPNLSATTSPADVAENALRALQRLAGDDDDVKRLFQERPSVAMRKLEPGAENATNGVQNNALGLLSNLAFNDDNAREMVIKNPTLVSLLMAKVKSASEQVQVEALGVLRVLALNVDNKREMTTKNPTLAPLLVAKMISNSEQVQEGALGVLNSLAVNADNATEMMTTSSALLLPLLVAKMNGKTPLEATRVVYNLSCSPANLAALRRNNLVVAALTKKREDEDFSFLSLLSLVNLFEAEEGSEVLKTKLAMLRRVFELLALAMNTDGRSLNKPLLVLHNLCVVKHNRQLLWSKYGSKLLSSVLAALQRAIEDKNAPATENAVSSLAQFSDDTEPLAWMRSNKLQLDQAIAQLAPFPKALKKAQLLQLILDQEVAETAASSVSATAKQPAPQGEKEIRQWLSKHKCGEEIANRLVKEDLVEAEDLENLSNLTPAELKMLIGFDAKQALTLGAALKEFF
ncbi:hypothetical protein BASA81_004201 [Batrachochytrium salamandrivorans]|nr:hypothetical protein BASA81_004201 [Batrachochytrium salamandrivorans]